MGSTPSWRFGTPRARSDFGRRRVFGRYEPPFTLCPLSLSLSSLLTVLYLAAFGVFLLLFLLLLHS